MTTPPRVARVLVETLLPPAEREFALGDLEEAFRAYATRRGAAAARRWYWSQAWRLVAYRGWRRSHSDRRSGPTPGDTLMRLALQDLRHHIRLLRAQPAFAASVVVTLSLGVALSTALFSTVSSVLLRPLPYPEARRLVSVWEDHTARHEPKEELSPANFLDFRERATAFESLCAFAPTSLTLVKIGEPVVLDGLRVSGDYFYTLGTRAFRGRLLERHDDQPGAAPVVVISHDLWKQRFAGDPHVVGRSIVLDGTATTVVGVTPSEFVAPGMDAEFFTPASLESDANNRGGHFMFAIGRLRPGVMIAQADADLERVAGRLQREHPRTNAGVGATVLDLRAQLVGDVRPTLLVLFAAVGFVLLIACANVANLLLAQALLRRHELGIRVALGAQPLRLMAQTLTESLGLAALGGVLGVIVSVWLVRLLNVLLPETFLMLGGGRPQSLTMAGTRQAAGSIDWRVALFALGVTVATGLLFGLAPALRARRTAMEGALREHARGSGGSRRQRRLREALIVGELAIALMLVVAAGLLIRSVSRLQLVDPGFDATGVLTMRTALPLQKYRDASGRKAYYDAVLERVQRLPGVESAGYTTFLPLTFTGLRGGVAVEAPRTERSGPPTSSTYRVVSADYFRALHIPLLSGRAFRASDGPGAPSVAIVSRSFARRHWGDEVSAAIGRRIKPLSTADSDDPWTTVVGVVGDVRQSAVDTVPIPDVYTAYMQGAPFPFAEPRDLAVRVQGDALALGDDIQAVIRAVDPEQPITQVRLMADIQRGSAAGRRVYMYLLGSFAVLALGLAALGVYSVMAYLVSARTAEMAVRLALGAHPRQVRRLVLADGSKIAMAGLLAGTCGAVATVRVLERVLYEVEPFDALTFLSAFAVLAVAALAASLVPAWRATRIDPMLALRTE
jgi:putative ABC transport system permease protein